MTKKPNIEALEQLARVLRKVTARKKKPGERFDMNVFYSHDLSAHPDIANMSLSKFKRTPVHEMFPANCGTVACAAGWAALDPWFTERGLVLRTDTRARLFSHDEVSATPAYKRSIGFNALRRFFNIDAKTSDYLFAEERTGKAGKAARRVEYAIKKLQEPGFDTSDFYTAPWR